MERMSATVVEELRRVWAGVRVDDVCAVDRALRTGSELNRSPVETASYVFASDASLRRVAAGRRNLPGVLAGVSGLLWAGRARRFLFSPHVSLEALPFVFSSSCLKFDQN